MDPELLCLTYDHQGNKIIGVCVEQNCPFQGPACFSCIQQYHKQHFNQVLNFDEFRKIQKIAIDIKQSVPKLIKQLQNTIEQLKKMNDQDILDESQDLTNHTTQQMILLVKQVFRWRKNEELITTFTSALQRHEQLLEKARKEDYLNDLQVFEKKPRKPSFIVPLNYNLNPDPHKFIFKPWSDANPRYLKEQYMEEPQFQIKCRFIGHEEQQVLGVCLDINCTKSRLVCFICLDSHISHLEKITDIAQFKQIEKFVYQLTEQARNFYPIFEYFQSLVQSLFRNSREFQRFYPTATRVIQFAELILKILSSDSIIQFDQYAKQFMSQVRKINERVKDFIAHNQLKSQLIQQLSFPSNKFQQPLEDPHE